MSAPFRNQTFTFKQPDGTELEVIGTGNQHQAQFWTKDGYAVVRDPLSGFYEYARQDDDSEGLEPSGVMVGSAAPEALGLPAGLRMSTAAIRGRAGVIEGLPESPTRWEARRAERRMLSSRAALEGIAPAPPARGTVGNFVGLTLLVEFPDVLGTIPQSDVDDFCNDQGYTGYGNSGSVRDYFFDVSDGKLTYTNIVLPYYRTKHTRSYYTNPQVKQPIRAWEVIKEALHHHLAAGVDFSGLSSDGQDYVYALNVFYAGARVNNWAQGLWPHAFHLAAPLKLAPGKFAYDYQVTNMGDELSLGTFCHENGHMLCDFPDLYDYGYESNGAGVFCLMCSGGSGSIREKNPTQVGAYLKHAAGWTSAITSLHPGAQISLQAGRNEFAAFKKNSAEYFIIENRANQGRDAELVGSGLAIWHIDETGSNDHEQGTPTQHYECALVQADGLRQLEGNVNEGDPADLFQAGHRDSFSAQTNPNSSWWDQSGSGLTIENISNAGPTMTFKVV